jgi:hypothetical protein
MAKKKNNVKLSGKSLFTMTPQDLIDELLAAGDKRTSRAKGKVVDLSAMRKNIIPSAATVAAGAIQDVAYPLHYVSEVVKLIKDMSKEFAKGTSIAAGALVNPKVARRKLKGSGIEKLFQGLARVINETSLEDAMDIVGKLISEYPVEMAMLPLALRKSFARAQARGPRKGLMDKLSRVDAELEQAEAALRQERLDFGARLGREGRVARESRTPEDRERETSMRRRQQDLRQERHAVRTERAQNVASPPQTFEDQVRGRTGEGDFKRYEGGRGGANEAVTEINRRLVPSSDEKSLVFPEQTKAAVSRRVNEMPLQESSMPSIEDKKAIAVELRSSIDKILDQEIVLRKRLLKIRGKAEKRDVKQQLSALARMRTTLRQHLDSGRPDRKELERALAQTGAGVRLFE